MKIGFYYFATDYSMPVVEVARALEERGYESLFVPEHTHIPASRRTWPGGAELPRSTPTRWIPSSLWPRPQLRPEPRLGTGICLLTERDPIVTAKEVATLDLISAGASSSASAPAGTSRRWRTTARRSRRAFVMVDRAKAMQAIWTQDEASYRGEFTAFEPIWSWPKSVQKPHPPSSGRRDQVHVAPSHGIL